MSVLTMHIPPVCQGQIVEVAYGLHLGTVYRRVTDRSDSSVEYARSRALADDEGDYWNREPGNRRWAAISEAQFLRETEEDY